MSEMSSNAKDLDGAGNMKQKYRIAQFLSLSCEAQNTENTGRYQQGLK